MLRVAALCSGVGVALGAFGAHGLAEQLEAMDRVATWDTAVRYHLVHGVAMFALAAHPLARRTTVAIAWLIGIALFSGSLYLLCALDDGEGTWNWLGAVTPLGGTALLVGWGVAAWATPGADQASA